MGEGTQSIRVDSREQFDALQAFGHEFMPAAATFNVGTVVGGTAGNGTDYALLSGSVTIAAGATFAISPGATPELLVAVDGDHQSAVETGNLGGPSNPLPGD